jgi:hypothetical protein
LTGHATLAHDPAAIGDSDLRVVSILESCEEVVVMAGGGADGGRRDGLVPAVPKNQVRVWEIRCHRL